MSSRDATIKQGGSEGSAVNKLQNTSAIGKNRKPPTQTISGGLGPSDFSNAEPMSSPTNRGDADDSDDDSVDSLDNNNGGFDVVNPLFEHAGGNDGRFRGTSFSNSARSLTFSSFRTGKTPIGRVSVSVFMVNGLKSNRSAEARVRFSLNGYTDFTDKTKRMFELMHYPLEGSESLPSELSIEVNDVDTDSFWGAGYECCCSL
jgi:hypothetical protein